MMNAEGKNNVLTLFRKWLSGDVRRKEEARLEQLSADDPFVAEALEGYRGFPEEEHAKQLTSIKAKLRKRYQKEERKSVFYLYRVAAVVAFLIVALGGFWWISAPTSNQEFALQDQSEEVSAPSVQTKPEEGTSAIESDEVIAERSEPSARFQEQKSKTNTVSKRQKDVIADAAPINAKAKKEEITTVGGAQEEEIALTSPSPVAPPTVAEELSPAADAIVSSNEQQISGTITDVDGAPIFGAKVSIPGTDITTFTDPSGAYILSPPLITPAEEIEVSFAGFEDQTLPIGRNDTVNITLLPNQIAVNEPQQADEEALNEAKALRVKPSRAQSGNSVRIINGTVTDGSTGEPLIGANILIPGTSSGTVTDFDGKYSINVPEGTDELQISYTGYNYQTVLLNDNQTIVDVTLESGDLLDEVVVTGYSAKSKEQSSPQVAFTRPADGYKSLKEYIKKNLVYPESAKANEIEGKVKLRFKVYPTGRLGQFEVLKSLGYGCDQEAIRLLQNGPAWEVTGSSEPMQKTYSIRFKLP